MNATVMTHPGNPPFSSGGFLGEAPASSTDGMTYMAEWLDQCESELVHPDVVRDQLKRTGWNEFQAAAAAEDYRRRYDEHTLGYAALLVSTGVAALAAGTVGHELTGGLDHPVNRDHLAIWLSVLVCTLPFAGWAHQWAARVDREDVVAVWSRPRRQLALVLLWACAVVGGGRLLLYAGRLIEYLVRAPGADGYSLAAGALNVAIAVGIALPLGLWAYDFLHRFDGEDPTIRPERRRRPARPATTRAPVSPPDPS